jgi:hypothetical protein
MYSYLVKPQRMGQRSDSPQDPIGSPDKKEKRLIARFREAIRSRRYSRQTKKTYWYWIRSYPFAQDRAGNRCVGFVSIG